MYKRENRQEVLAEYILLLLSYFTLMYTGYISDEGVLRLIGFGEVFACMFIIVIKVVTITVITLRSLFVKLLNVYYGCNKKKYRKKKGQREPSKEVEVGGDIEQRLDQSDMNESGQIIYYERGTLSRY